MHQTQMSDRKLVIFLEQLYGPYEPWQSSIMLREYAEQHKTNNKCPKEYIGKMCIGRATIFVLINAVTNKVELHKYDSIFSRETDMDEVRLVLKTVEERRPIVSSKLYRPIHGGLDE